MTELTPAIPPGGIYSRSIPIPAEEKKRLLALTPARYIGLAAELARRV